MISKLWIGVCLILVLISANAAAQTPAQVVPAGDGFYPSDPERLQRT